MSDFTIDFRNTRFLETSKVGAHPNRLNWRCELLLTRNQEVIKGKRILDIASHDGRFSYACLQLGASHVTGIEGRSQLVEGAKENLSKEGFNSACYSFICGDIFDYLSKFEPKQFDTILCCGFFYHTVRQNELLSEVKRIKPQTFILDTVVAPVPTIFKLLRSLEGTTLFKDLVGTNGLARRDILLDNLLQERYFIYLPEDNDVNNESHTIDTLNFIAYPSNELLQILLKAYGFSFRRINWDTAGIEDWTSVEQYKIGDRVSYVAQMPNNQEPS